MRLKKTIILIAVAFFIATSAVSQSLQFRNYSVKDGLPSSEVYSVIQDSKGYMWFCTDRGVSRFNGYEFKTYTTANGLTDNTVFEAIEDYKGRIWFKAFSGKLSYFYNDSIYRLPLNDSLNRLLGTTRISSIVIDSSDNLNLSTYGFPYILRIDLKNNYRVSHIPLPKNIMYLATLPGEANVINGFCDRVAKSTDSLYLFSITQGGAVNKEHIYSWEQRETFISRLHDKAIKLPGAKIATSQGSRFMILNKDSILFSYDFNTQIINLIHDRSGVIWILLDKKNPVCFKNGELVYMPILKFLEDKRVTGISKDVEGGLWFTTLENGIYYLPSLDFKFINSENGLPGNKVNFITVAPDKKIWMIVDDNIITTLQNDSIKYHTLKCAPAGSFIKDILFHTDGSVWISGDLFGIYVFSDQYSDLPIANINPGVEYNMVETDDKAVWAIGISRLDVLKGKGKTIEMHEKMVFPERMFTICTGDGAQNLWIGTFHGLVEYSNGSVNYLGNKYPVLKNRIDDIKKSNEGDLWIATRDTGIILKTKNGLTHITTREGLVSNFCECICIDYKNNIWVGTNKGLSHIYIKSDPSGNCHIDSIRNISSSVLNEINQVACIDSIVYAASNKGLVSFDMDKVSTDHTPPPIYITGLRINNRSISVPETVLNLHYDENYIIINYVGLTYSDGGHTQYKYMMQGIDTGWIFTRDNDIQYPKLAPGDYTFKISAMNKDEVWSTHPASIHFIIAPPFWATWWARTLFILTIIGFGYWRIRAIEKREKRKTEINKQLAKAEVRELKAQFDPHFFFNNLNTVSHLIDSSPVNAHEYVDELSQFYHYTLSQRKKEFTELGTEIEQAIRYCNMLKIRFGGQFKVEWNINKQYERYFILTNSLQLLIENVIKHNNITNERLLLVEISSNEKNCIIVKNEVQPKKNILSTGVGLTSINELYMLLTGKKIKISHTSEYFSVEIPLLIPKEYESFNNRR